MMVLQVGSKEVKKKILHNRLTTLFIKLCNCIQIQCLVVNKSFSGKNLFVHVDVEQKVLQSPQFVSGIVGGFFVVCG